MRTTGGDMEDRKRRKKERESRWLKRIENRLSHEYDSDIAEMIAKIKMLTKENEQLDEGLTRAIQEIDRLKYGRNEQ